MSYMPLGVRDTLLIEELLKAAGQLLHVKRSPERLHPEVQVHL